MKRIFSFILVLLLVFANTTIFAGTFDDINDHWANEAIQKWLDKGLINGFDDGTFRPDDSMTRAQFVCMVNRAMNYTTETEIEFNDVKEGDWFYKDVCIAKAQGYINGESETKFAPNKTITREQAIAIIIRINNLEENNDVSAFTDKNKISSWAAGYVGAAAEVEFINGYEDGTVRPLEKLKRAEALKMLDNAVFTNNIIINKDEQKISDKNVGGNVIVTKSVGDGTVYIDGCKIEGSLIINGGGEHSVVITKSTVNDIQVNKESVHMTIDKSTTVNTITVNTPCTIDNEGKVEKINIDASGVTLTGEFGEIVVDENVEEPVVNDDSSSSGSGAGGGEGSGGVVVTPDRKITITVSKNNQQNPISANISYKENEKLADVYNSMKADSTIKAKLELLLDKLQSVKVKNYDLCSQEVYDKIADMLEIEKSTSEDSLYQKCMPSDFSNISIEDVDKIVANLASLSEHVSDATRKTTILGNVESLSLNTISLTKGSEDVEFTVKFGSDTFTQDTMEEMIKYIINNINMLTGKIDNITINSIEIRVTSPEVYTIKIEKK